MNTNLQPFKRALAGGRFVYLLPAFLVTLWLMFVVAPSSGGVGETDGGDFFAAAQIPGALGSVFGGYSLMLVGLFFLATIFSLSKLRKHGGEVAEEFAANSIVALYFSGVGSLLIFIGFFSSFWSISHGAMNEGVGYAFSFVSSIGVGFALAAICVALSMAAVFAKSLSNGEFAIGEGSAMIDGRAVAAGVSERVSADGGEQNVSESGEGEGSVGYSDLGYPYGVSAK